MRTAEAPPRVAGVLNPLIGMNDRAAWATAPYRHEHGIERELGVNGWPEDQPTILRENKSMTTATYSQPCHVRT